MNPKVDAYLEDGCGRCSLYKTPDCKVNTWRKELIKLRSIVLDCGLSEEFKWKQPCYTFQNTNILLVSAFKDYAFISFFKGSLLKDTEKILSSPGENSQSTRQLRFTSIDEIAAMEATIKAYIYEAIEVEKAGLKVNLKKVTDYPVPEELQNKLDESSAFKTAFEALTPGRQRGYLLYFAQPKQAKTRKSRIEKSTPRILEGKGLHDR